MIRALAHVVGSRWRLRVARQLPPRGVPLRECWTWWAWVRRSLLWRAAQLVDPSYRGPCPKGLL